MQNIKPVIDYLNKHFPCNDDKWMISKNKIKETFFAILIVKEEDSLKVYHAIKKEGSEINYELLYDNWTDRLIRVFIKSFPPLLNTVKSTK